MRTPVTLSTNMVDLYNPKNSIKSLWSFSYTCLVFLAGHKAREDTTRKELHMLCRRAWPNWKLKMFYKSSGFYPSLEFLPIFAVFLAFVTMFYRLVIWIHSFFPPKEDKKVSSYGEIVFFLVFHFVLVGSVFLCIWHYCMLIC